MNGRSVNLLARLSIRERPAGSPILYQSWGKLLFMHWPVPVETLRPLIPTRLTIDTHEGNAWVGLIPFTVWNLRPRFVPPLPWISHFHEINVRTYVHLNGIPGIWFFSLDANRWFDVITARAFFHLPYYHARIQLEQRDKTILYTTQRKDSTRPAKFDATWTIGTELPRAEPGTLDFFLIERYCLYAASKSRLYRCRIFHRPWPLQQATLPRCHSSMLEADGLPTPDSEPLLHGAGPVHVEVWPLEEV